MNSTITVPSADYLHLEDGGSQTVNWTGIPCRLQPWYAYYVGGISTSSLCIFAIFGNLICIIVLSRPNMKSSVNLILLVLACSDLIQVICTLAMRGVHKILEKHCVGVYYTAWIQPIVTPYLFPIGTTAQMASVYLTVLVTLERYIAVCHPFKARLWFSIRKTKIFSGTVILFSFLYNLPTWFELEVRRRIVRDQFLGLALQRTALYQNPMYVIYYVNLGSFIIFRLIPFGLLAVLNGFICFAIQRMNHLRKTMTQSQTQEVSVARMLVCIVIVFLLCNLVTIISHMMESFGGPNPLGLLAASNFLVLLNAAVNFVIYCFLGRKFRKVLLRTFGFRVRENSNTTQDSEGTMLVLRRRKPEPDIVPQITLTSTIE